jgi:uncharacterized membrane protein
MTSAGRMLIAGISMLAVTLALGIYTIIFGTLFAKVIPLFKAYTPPAYWSMLGGDQIVWMTAFVWVLIILCEIFIIVRLWNEASRTTSYNSGDDWS